LCFDEFRNFFSIKTVAVTHCEKVCASVLCQVG
jgi:hypothetical protein